MRTEDMGKCSNGTATEATTYHRPNSHALDDATTSIEYPKMLGLERSPHIEIIHNKAPQQFTPTTSNPSNVRFVDSKKITIVTT